MFGNERFDLPVHLVQPALQEANRGIHITLRLAHASYPPIAFCDEHFNELPMTSDQLPDLFKLLIPHGAYRRLHAASPKCANVSASIGSVFASLPFALANALTCRGLAIATGRPAFE